VILVQVRDVKALRGDDANMISIWRGEEEKTARDQKAQSKDQTQQSADQEDMLSRVRRYRNTFAEILVIGSILQELEGNELNRFERWRRVDEAEMEEEGREENEDLEDVADERYDGITGMIFKRHARKLREKDMGRIMSQVERAEGRAEGKDDARSKGWKRFNTR
jgi:potassium channel subfamily K